MAQHPPGDDPIGRGTTGARQRYAPWLWVVVLLSWVHLWNELTSQGPGIPKAPWLALILALFLGVALFGWKARWPAGSPVLKCFVGLLLLVALLWNFRVARENLGRSDFVDSGEDIAQNTIAAENLLLAGRNPYRGRSQLQNVITPGPGITIQDGKVSMLGLPYSYGYPYFPLMFLGYLPFRLVANGVHSIRVANLCLELIDIVLMALLVRRFARRRDWLVVGGLCAVASLSCLTMPAEVFYFSVTDPIIATFALAGYVLFTRQRLFAAGVLFGMAQSCKLLPGPFLVAPVLVWLVGRPGFRQVLLGYALGCACLVGPFLAAAPAEFISSTILFYTTFHWTGDSTSLWFAVPEAWKSAFSLSGYCLSAGAILLAWPFRETRDERWPISLAFVSYLIFVAFARLIHLNYFWSFYPLGCAALFLNLLERRDSTTRGLDTRR